MGLSLRDIADLLVLTVDSGASDLHISVGAPPVLRIDGVLQFTESAPVSAAEAEQMVNDLLGSERGAEFQQMGEADFAYSIEGKARFRVNVYRERGEMGIAVRNIPLYIPTLQELALPSIISTLALKTQGLILVTGPTGSGKSSTLAAMIDDLNHKKQRHIMTLEDPIEFIYSNAKSLIHQREVGRDTSSFANGLRASLRQDPDVILVGEMRDLETISSAISIAETGHLVLATLHTTDAPQSIDRIIDAFPAHQQKQIRAQLAAVLVAVISQRLLPKCEGGRVCATEIMINTPAVANLIRTEKTHQIKSVMQTSRMQGMHTLEMCVRDLRKNGIVDEAASEYISEVKD
ncbi:twitching motility protein PilT [Paenibacillus sp. DS2015]|uniref:type IV pilus twitching motility protein PilT n=1 Tax=Paenibacillus sp. DS2015 TaxID=3373917 RepID=UPI003D1B9A3A